MSKRNRCRLLQDAFSVYTLCIILYVIEHVIIE